MVPPEEAAAEELAEVLEVVVATGACEVVVTGALEALDETAEEVGLGAPVNKGKMD